MTVIDCFAQTMETFLEHFDIHGLFSQILDLLAVFLLLLRLVVVLDHVGRAQKMS